MSRKPTLWVFGHSSCLPFNLLDGVCWTDLVANKLGIQCNNFAEPASDNLFIYHSFISNLNQIRSDDIVIIGWSHPNRKSFVLDRSNDAHMQAINNKSMIYKGTPEFFRSKRPVSPKDKWPVITPHSYGNEYFDLWFKNYYDSYECALNFQAYLDSVRSRVSCVYIPFYFSRDSVKTITESDFYWLDFILDNKCYISKTDLHPSQEGHCKMADLFLETIDDCLNNHYNTT